MNDDKPKTDGKRNYRQLADSDLNKRLAELADALGVNIDTLDVDPIPCSQSEPASAESGESDASSAYPSSDDLSSRETAASLAESNPPETNIAAQLASMGMTKTQADAVIRRYPDLLDDPESERALAKTVEYARRGKQNMRDVDRIHVGHRKRLRDSVRRDRELNGFSDIEILETLLSFVIPQRDTNATAHELLDKFGSLLSVIRTPAKDLSTVKGMTDRAARLIPMLTAVCLWDVRSDISIRNHADAVDFFGALYLGGRSKGVNVAYLDSDFGLIALEKASGTHTEKARAIVGSAYKYSAEYVIATYCSFDIFPEKYNVAEFVDILRRTLNAVDARLIDCMIFGAAGYYTLGTSVFTDGAAHFEYIPLITFSRSPELINRMIDISLSERKRKQKPANDTESATKK